MCAECHIWHYANKKSGKNVCRVPYMALCKQKIRKKCVQGAIYGTMQTKNWSKKCVQGAIYGTLHKKKSVEKKMQGKAYFGGISGRLSFRRKMKLWHFFGYGPTQKIPGRPA
jgi:hypothetical protein